MFPAVHFGYDPSGSGNEFAQRIWKEITEESDHASVNLKPPFQQWAELEGYLKLGLFYDQVDRKYKQDGFYYEFDDTSFAAPWERRWSQVYVGDGHTITAFNDDVDYTGDQKTFAWYQMLDLPVIMLTAQSEDSDIIAGLELGADDYVAKPFSLRVLVARVRRVLRKKVAQNLTRGVIKMHDLTIDPARCEVLLGGKPVSLTFSEFNILYTLAKRPGVVFTRYQIVDALHGSDHIVTERAIDVQIAYLRKKLGPAKDYIETVRGVGYRFKDRPAL